MKYSQLTQEQRYQIYALLKMEHSKAQIASVLGINRSTIYREVKRNRGDRGYRAQQAHRFAVARSKKTIPRLSSSDWTIIEEKLRHDWSPEQVAGRLRKEGLQVSHEWIYQHIYADKQTGGDLWKHLRCQKKRRKRAGGRDRRGQIPDRTSIEERPEIVSERKRLGDWEGDTIIGAAHKGAVLTLVDRMSGYTLLGALPKKESERVVQQTTRLLKPIQAVESLTVDNGKEFAGHIQITEQTGAAVYFAHPYSSWERGTNENTNGLIRQYLPKIRRLDDVLEEELEQIMFRLNHRPRKRLDYQTPHEVFFPESVALGT
jgi:IS30 family transposase